MNQQAWSRLWSIYTDAPIGLAVVGSDFRFLHVNNALAELNGLPVEAHLGRTIREVVPTVADTVEDVIERVLKTGMPIRGIEVRSRIPADASVPRTVTVHFQPLRNAEGRVTEVNIAVEDVTEQKRMERLLLESEQRTSAALRVGNIGVFERTLRPHSTLYWDHTVRKMWGYSETAPVSDEVLLNSLHPDDLSALLEFREKVKSSPGPMRFDTEYRINRLSDGALRWIAICIDVICDALGPVKIIGTAQDITERKMSEERARIMMQEVNHRSKNLLAVVQAIASQTSKTADPVTFTRQFAERLMSLSSSLDLVVRNHWSGVYLENLVTSQLAHFRALIGGRIQVNGPQVFITPTAAQDLGMALHELATNAAKYGALRGEVGDVELAWSIQEGTRGTVLRLSWTEKNGPAVVTPEQRGFGTLVITRMLQSSIKADVTLEYDVRGLHWSIDAPASAVLVQ